VGELLMKFVLRPFAAILVVSGLAVSCGTEETKKTKSPGLAGHEVNCGGAVVAPQPLPLTGKGLQPVPGPIPVPDCIPTPHQGPLLGGNHVGQFPGGPCVGGKGGDIYRPVPGGPLFPGPGNCGDCLDDSMNGCGGGIGIEPYPIRPMPIPVQMPIVLPGNCGKGGVICPGQGPGQFPVVDIGGHPIHSGDLNRCLAQFGQQGIPMAGAWPVEVLRMNTVSVLSNSLVEDRSIGPKIVIIRSTNVAGALLGGGVHYVLANPDALYCMSDVSVLENIQISSCWSNSVAFSKSVNVLSNRSANLLDCR